MKTVRFFITFALMLFMGNVCMAQEEVKEDSIYGLNVSFDKSTNKLEVSFSFSDKKGFKSFGVIVSSEGSDLYITREFTRETENDNYVLNDFGGKIVGAKNINLLNNSKNDSIHSLSLSMEYTGDINSLNNPIMFALFYYVFGNDNVISYRNVTNVRFTSLSGLIDNLDDNFIFDNKKYFSLNGIEIEPPFFNSVYLEISYKNGNVVMVRKCTPSL